MRGHGRREYGYFGSDQDGDTSADDSDSDSRYRQNSHSNQPTAGSTSIATATPTATVTDASNSHSSNTRSSSSNNPSDDESSTSPATTTTDSTAAGRPETSDTQAFQSFIVDQLTKIQEQNANLQAKMFLMEKEQEQFYLHQVKKLETGFKNVNKCVDDISILKKTFQELVGIMSGERLRFLDHSDENVVTNTENTNQEQINKERERARNQEHERLWRDMDFLRDVRSHDDAISTGRVDRISVKNEFDPTVGALLNGTVPNSQVAAAIRNSEPARIQQSNDDAVDDTTNQSMENHSVSDETASSAASTLLQQAMDYKMNRAVQNVIDLAREYYEGFPGKPSILNLERRFGTSWRKGRSERVLFTKRYCIIKKIEMVKKFPERYGLPSNIKRNQAIKVIENIRLGNNNFKGRPCRLSLAQLYQYFSQKHDKIEDYALELKNKALPRRIYLLRDREDQAERDDTTNTLTTNESTGEVPISIMTGSPDSMATNININNNIDDNISATTNNNEANDGNSRRGSTTFLHIPSPPDGRFIGNENPPSVDSNVDPEIAG
ncbi:Euc1p NDAI_0H02680 [Naumovozyma dairenensis CBS 421]|uniref:Transcription activator GCR1-like domain-containing protein n=1 Tax=Naumovozyma dairenensis (strain ATCC 10597 / BCRC 20456 / CBS 421 / NBRC 0211 / NRRL Y-12639) TaxID=1071378 RepID=G0WF81_NAUDC|nr:hypothetical protein NDAI_0H02680 [Naumovozyma dairenensis CBS 421]CCD26442.1 hypothetical protein NDAI_0H02680 [Naumovozyma dairenensis CBS 421]